MSTSSSPPPDAPKFLDRLRTALQIRALPPEVIDAQVGWVRQYIGFHHLQHPENQGVAAIGAFLTHLALERHEPLSRQAQARQALLFLYRDFLHRELGPIPVTWTPPARNGPTAKQPPRLLEQLHRLLRLKHYAKTTAKSYVNWVRRFILFHGTRHPLEMGAREVEAFLTHLAVEGQVAAATQLQAFHALLFLYQHLLEVELGRLDAVRARRPEKLPEVLSTDEVAQVLAGVQGAGGLYVVMAKLLYGSGLRISECCGLRVKDVHLERGQLFVRGGKWHKDRVVMLPRTLRVPLETQLQQRRALHERDLGQGFSP